MKVHEDLLFRGKIDGSPGWSRHRNVLMAGGIDMYSATFDPWYLVFAHAIADLEATQLLNPASGYDGNDYEPGLLEFLRFTGDPVFRDKVYLPYARRFASADYAGWGGKDQIETTTFGWRFTGEEHFLRRLAHEIDWASQATYEGDPEYYRGYHVRDQGWEQVSLFTGYYLKTFPYALAAFEDAGGVPAPIPNRFHQSAEDVRTLPDGAHLLTMPTILLRKAPDAELPLNLQVANVSNGAGHYRVIAPDGSAVSEGEWNPAEAHDVVIPSHASPGVYRLEVDVRTPSVTASYRQLQGIYLPVSPAGTPEVVVPREPALPRAVWETQYWFRLPQDASTLEVELYVRPDHRQLRRMSIWDGDGVRVWDHQMTTNDLRSTDERTVTARVDVPADQRGKLWRLTLPGRNGGFRFATPIIPAFAISADRWFDPESP